MAFQRLSARSRFTAGKLFLFVACFFSLLSSVHIANAQFSQQGTAKHGSGNVGPDREGSSVAISSDGSTAIIGGPADNQNTGAAWIFNRKNGTWAQQGSKLTASAAQPGDREGTSVALSSDGNTALVGSPGDSGGSGAALVFIRVSGSWTFQNKLTGQGGFGTSVSLSSDGNTALIGIAATGSGAVFTRSAGSWVQQSSNLRGEGTGVSVALSGDGKTAIVGNPNDDYGRGAATVFTQIGGVWSARGSRLQDPNGNSQYHQGSAVSLSFDGLTAAVGGPGDGSGGASWIYTSEGGVWSQQGKLLASGNPAVPGSSVSLSPDGNMVAVGGFNVPPQPGAAPKASFWIYTRANGTWTQQSGPNMPLDTVGGSTAFWASLALSSDTKTAVLGDYGNGDYFGSVWFFVAPPTRLEHVVSGLINPDGTVRSAGTGGFTVEHQNNGQYKIIFSAPFAEPPAVIGSQSLYGSTSQFTLDNVVFPLVAPNSVTVLTGDAGGSHQDRGFSFIARGVQ